MALPLPDSQREQLAPYLAGAAAAVPELRWVPAANLHFTLRFLGSVEPAALDRVRAELAAIRSQPFTIRLGPLGTFGGRRVRVVWLGLQKGGEGAEAAVKLAGAVESACRRAGGVPEVRPFRPHLTLARSRDRGGCLLGELPEPPAVAAWTADRIVLYRSRLGSGPARYEPLVEVPLDA